MHSTSNCPVASLMGMLATERPIFHSEADFQHALAWKIHEVWSDAGIRLERKPPHLNERMYVDVWITHGDSIFALELKYLTRGLRVTVGDEQFNLLNQAAQDISRYDCLKDIQRLERVVADRSDITGYAIVLSNDSAYWKPSARAGMVDAAFRILEGRTVSGVLGWAATAGAGTTRGREKEIVLSGKYPLTWHEYSAPSPDTYGRFRYLLIEVKGKQP